MPRKNYYIITIFLLLIIAINLGEYFIIHKAMENFKKEVIDQYFKEEIKNAVQGGEITDNAFSPFLDSFGWHGDALFKFENQIDSFKKRCTFYEQALNGSMERRDFLDSFYWYGSREIDSLIKVMQQSGVTPVMGK